MKLLKSLIFVNLFKLILSMNHKSFFSILVLSVFSFFVSAQIFDPVKWNHKIEVLSETELNMVFEATIDKGWHLYSQNIPDGGPIPTSFTFEEDQKYLKEGITNEPPSHEVFDPNFNMKLNWFEGGQTIKFIQKIKINNKNKFIIKASVEYMVCDDERCLPPEIKEFNFFINGASEQENNKVADKKEDLYVRKNLPIWHREPVNQDLSKFTSDIGGGHNHDRSIIMLFLLSFVGGLLALLTPCVFPMIPLTVSFFTKQSKTKKEGIKKAIIYGVSIILIYLILGTAVVIIFGPDSLNALSTDPWFNLLFFLLLVVFAISFFGAFEITLPSSWINAADKRSEKGGLIGIFFMALVLALVSFSCTGPIVGTLLVEAASSGNILMPLVGMLGFSLALALPFTLFAMFPGWINSMPKSGNWLNSVKVSLGYIELAMALKFLSVADMVLKLELLTRGMFVISWIIILLCWGAYLLNITKIWNKHESYSLPKNKFRVLLSLGIIFFAFYLTLGITKEKLETKGGIWDKISLNLISGFPPPKGYAEKKDNLLSTLPEGVELISYDIPAFKDYERALEYAKKVNKPLFLDFTGYGCVNCREVEDKVWSKEDVNKILKENFVVTSLYVDYKKDLPEDKIYISPSTGKKIKTIGNLYSDFQITRFKTNAQPYYVIMDYNRNVIHSIKAYDTNPKSYKAWLLEGLKAYRK